MIHFSFRELELSHTYGDLEISYAPSEKNTNPGNQTIGDLEYDGNLGSTISAISSLEQYKFVFIFVTTYHSFRSQSRPTYCIPSYRPTSLLNIVSNIVMFMISLLSLFLLFTSHSNGCIVCMFVVSFSLSMSPLSPFMFTDIAS